MGRQRRPCQRRLFPIRHPLFPILPSLDTGELSWYWPAPHAARKNGLVTVDTPRSQALIGLVRAQGKSVTNFAADVAAPFCTLLLTSLEEKPIANSTRLLLVAGGPVENTGQQWNVAGTDVTAWGGPPTLIHVVKGTITLRHIAGASSVTSQPLDGAGQPTGSPAQALHSGNDWVIPIGDTPTTWYAISVTR